MSKKLFPYVIALAALAVSASAAFYSVSGLMKLFAGASLAVGIMAGSLEVSKLVIASLLYQYWGSLNKVLRTYLTLAALVLILITSAGIYGFLSAAYQETANKDQITTQQITALQAKKQLFEQTRDNLIKEKQSLSELRGALSKASTTQFTDKKGNLVVKSNNASFKQIESATKSDDRLTQKLDMVNDSIFNLGTKILQVQTNSTASSELGPLKYLSGLTGYPMDKIINWFILVVIFVFDPLAIALVIAANFAFKQKEEVQPANHETAKLEVESEPVQQEPLVQKQAQESQDWEIQDEEKEPYQVYTGPHTSRAAIHPMDREIESIQQDRSLSPVARAERLSEVLQRYRQQSEGKRYW